MSYLTVEQADQVIGSRVGWSVPLGLRVRDIGLEPPLTERLKLEALERATQRIEVLPFETDPSPEGYSELATRLETRTLAIQASEGKVFRNRSSARWTDGMSKTGEHIPTELAYAVAELAVFYALHPLRGTVASGVDSISDIHPGMRDLPIMVVNALWAWLDPIFKSGVDETLPFQIVPPVLDRPTAVALSED